MFASIQILATVPQPTIPNTPNRGEYQGIPGLRANAAIHQRPRRAIHIAKYGSTNAVCCVCAQIQEYADIAHNWDAPIVLASPLLQITAAPPVILVTPTLGRVRQDQEAPADPRTRLTIGAANHLRPQGATHAQRDAVKTLPLRLQPLRTTSPTAPAALSDQFPMMAQGSVLSQVADGTIRANHMRKHRGITKA